MCVYADPNYGAMWFFCRQHPLDTPRDVLQNARLRMQLELFDARTVYTRALLKEVGVVVPMLGGVQPLTTRCVYLSVRGSRCD